MVNQQVEHIDPNIAPAPAAIPHLDVNSLTRLNDLLSPAGRFALSQTNKNMFEFFHRFTVRDFLRATIRGEETAALAMLRANPALLMERGHPEKGITTDYSGRKYSGLTAFQIALCALDNEMAGKMKAIFLEAYPETGQRELDAQFNEVFPNGFDTHLAEQQASAEAFEHDIIDPLVKVFDEIDPDTNEENVNDLKAALRKENNHSKLCQALNQFRDAFTQLAHIEAVFNPLHLLKAFDKYNDKLEEWYVDENNPHCWLRVNLFWRQFIGFIQRFLPANFAQDFAQGLFYRVDKNEQSRRSFHFRFDDGAIFPLDFDSHSGLGFDYAVVPAAVADATAGGSRSLYQAYVKQKRLACQSMQPLPKRDKVRRCIIQ